MGGNGSGDNVKIVELASEDEELKKLCAAEVKEKVKSWSYQHNWKGNQGCEAHRVPAFYGDGYEYDGGYKHPDGRAAYSYLGNKTKIKLADVIVEDIDRLMTIAERNMHDGGVFTLPTWNEYILDTLKTVVEAKLEKKANCRCVLSFNEAFADSRECGSCKVAKSCSYWTKYFEETEEDAKDQLAGCLSEKGGEVVIAGATD